MLNPIARPVAPVPPRRTLSLDGAWDMVAGSVPSSGVRAARPPMKCSFPLAGGRGKPTVVPSQWAVQEPGMFNYGGSVWYQKTFTVPADMDGRVRLQFDGVDYKSEVFLNGKKLGDHEGYFAPFAFDVTDQVRRDGSNTLQVRVESDADRRFAKEQIKGVFEQHDCRPGNVAAGATVGNTGGIWNHVHLDGSGPVRIDQVHVHTDLSKDHAQAGLTFEYTLNSDTEREVKLCARYSDRTLEKTVQLQPGLNKVTLVATEKDPKLWWTWDRGTPNLYRLDSSVEVDGKPSHESTTQFGIRSLRFDKTHGTIYVNDEPVFQRGVNYLPTEWLSTYPSSRFTTDLEGMKGANLNAVRVHAHVLPEAFYQEADKQGMLVWQDFPLIWGQSLKPSFLRQAKGQYGEMIDLLRNHPSIFMWSAHNEAHPQNIPMDLALDKIPAAKDPSRPHKPYSLVLEHPYFGWYEYPFKTSMFDINHFKYALPSEYGAQAIPKSIGEFIPQDALWPMDEKSWQYHNFQPKFNRQHLGDPAAYKSLDDYVDTSQKYQYDFIRYYTEHFRRAKYHPTGGAYAFMWKESWPAIGWGVLDHEDRPKLGAEALRTAMAPVLLSIEWKQNHFKPGQQVEAGLWVVNDNTAPLEGTTIDWNLKHQNGTEVEHQLCPGDVGGDSAKSLAQVRFRIPRDAAPGEKWVLHADLKDAHGDIISSNDYMFGTQAPSVRYEPIYPTYPA